MVAAAAAKSLQSCLTLFDPIDDSPPGSAVPGILQARTLEWAAYEKWKWSCSVMSDSLQLRGLQPTRLLHPWDFPSKSTGVGCHCLLLSMVTSTLFIKVRILILISQNFCKNYFKTKHMRSLTWWLPNNYFIIYHHHHNYNSFIADPDFYEINWVI